MTGAVMATQTPSRTSARGEALARCSGLVVLVVALAQLVAGGWSFLAFERRVPPDRTWERVLATGTLRVATDPTYPPFASGVAGNPTGYDADLARLLAAGLGLQVVFVPTPFDNLYDALRNGSADVTIAALTVRAEEQTHVRYSSPYLDAGPLLLVRADAPYQTLADLAGHAAGAELGSDGDMAARSLARRMPGLRVDSSFESNHEALAALLAGRIDSAAFDGVTALTYLNTTAGLRALPSTDPAPLVVALPRDAATLQARVDELLATWRDDGTLAGLGARWFR